MMGSAAVALGKTETPLLMFVVLMRACIIAQLRCSGTAVKLRLSGFLELLQ